MNPWIIWTIAGLIVIGIVALCIWASKQGSTNPSSSNSTPVSPGFDYEDDDFDECRCSTPGGACCWK